MRVGISAFSLGAHQGGIETYVRNLVCALPGVDPDSEYALLLRSPLAEEIPGTEGMRRAVVQRPARCVPTSVTASLVLARERIEVVHVQESAPYFFPSRIVVTLHDIIYERYPRFFPPENVRRARMHISLTVRRAAVVLTVSQFSKQQIVRRYCVPPDKVIVAHGGPDPAVGPIHDMARLAAVRARYRTGERFILGMANPAPHKNLKTLIEAYVRLRRADATRQRLVLIGSTLPPKSEIFAPVQASGLADAVTFTGYVSGEDLTLLLNAADLFLYPSLYEGLGLPPLEAMACGTPVITSNAASLPEAVGGAALTVDPLNVEGLACAIAGVLDDADLRTRLSAKGLQRVSAFSWENAARIVAGAYRMAMNRR